MKGRSKEGEDVGDTYTHKMHESTTGKLYAGVRTLGKKTEAESLVGSYHPSFTNELLYRDLNVIHMTCTC